MTPSVNVDIFLSQENIINQSVSQDSEGSLV